MVLTSWGKEMIRDIKKEGEEIKKRIDETQKRIDEKKKLLTIKRANESKTKENPSDINKRQEKIDELNNLIVEAQQNYISSRGDKKYSKLMEKYEAELNDVYNSNYGLKEKKEIKQKIEKPKKEIKQKKSQINYPDDEGKTDNEDSSEDEKPIKKSKGRPKKTYKQSNVMKARSDVVKKGGKYTVDTDMNIRKGLDSKIMRALKKSIIDEVSSKMKGYGIRGGMIDEDEEEDEEDYKPVQPDPLIPPNRVQYQYIFEDYLNILEHDPVLKKLAKPDELRDLNIMFVLEDNIKQLDDENSMKKYAIVNRVMNVVDPAHNPLKHNIQLFKDAPSYAKAGINKEEYNHKKAELVRKDWTKNKKKIYNFFNIKEGKGIKGKGKGYGYDSDSDSSSDEDDIKTYGKLLKHLVGHIKDPEEKIDKKDFKQAIELIKKIKEKKGGKGLTSSKIKPAEFSNIIPTSRLDKKVKAPYKRKENTIEANNKLVERMLKDKYY